MAAYDNALAVIRKATQEFNRVRDAYRSGHATDMEFLTAKDIYSKAEMEYDAAFMDAQSNGGKCRDI